MSCVERHNNRGSKMSERKLVSRNVAIGLGIICIILIAGLGAAMVYYTITIFDKNNTISLQNSQLSSLNNTMSNQIAQQNTTIINLQSTIDRLKKLQNLTDQILSMHMAYDTDGNWLGTWNLVAKFNESTVSGGNTSNFQIFSAYGLWRFNFTVQQDLWFNIIQVVGSEIIVTGTYQATYTGEIDHGSVYYFACSVTTPSSYYIEFPTGSFAGNWTMTVEELDLLP